MRKRTYTRDFKLSVLNELEVKNTAEISRAHDIHPSLIAKWKHEYKKNPKKAFSGYGNPWKEEAEILRYKRLVGELYSEIDFLKKTLKKLQEQKAEVERVKSLR